MGGRPCSARPAAQSALPASRSQATGWRSAQLCVEYKAPPGHLQLGRLPALLSSQRASGGACSAVLSAFESAASFCPHLCAADALPQPPRAHVTAVAAAPQATPHRSPAPYLTSPSPEPCCHWWEAECSAGTSAHSSSTSTMPPARLTQGLAYKFSIKSR